MTIRQLLLLATLITLLPFQNIFACSCLFGGPEEDRNRLDHFEFAIKPNNYKNDTIDDHVYANLKIEKIWKGTLPDTIRVHTGYTYDGSASCNWNLAPSSTYILFGRQASNGSHYDISGCDIIPFSEARASHLDQIIKNILTVKTPLQLFYDPNTKTINTHDFGTIKSFYAYNLQNKLISTDIHQPLPNSELLIVILQTDQGTFRKRLIIPKP